MSRNRFIFISILPILLGIIPLIVFCFMNNSFTIFNGLLFGLAVVGMTSVYPDLYNIFRILKTVPKSAHIQSSGARTYYYE